MKTLASIGIIWLGCALAWLVLGSTLVARTGGARGDLDGEVAALWGPPLEQHPPSARYAELVTQEETVTTQDGRGTSSQRVSRQVQTWVDVPLEQSRVTAALALEHRRKGLLWYPTYAVDFRATYAFVNPDAAAPREVEFFFPLAAQNVGFDAFEVVGADGAPVRAGVGEGGARWKARVEPGARAEWTVAYRTRGTSRFAYALTHGSGEARDAVVTVTSDAERVDFPAGSLSPTRHGAAGGRWEGTWEFRRLISSAGVAVELPGRVNPGPLASRITFFAPVGLLFFFFVVALLGHRARVHLHPLHYFLLGCAFFAFHLLFSYLVDHLQVAPAFAIATAVSVALVVSYARLFVGWRFALREMGLSQAVYLVLFSLTFLWEGFTGLAITVGAIVTLFFVMQVTGKTDWRQLDGRPRPVVPAP